jgi:hypothetical protein
MASSRLARIVSSQKSDIVALEQNEEIEEADDARSGEEIDIVVAQIKRLARTAHLEFALRVGAVIIHHFYDGDTNGWRSRGPKTSSFRRLARHPDLPLSAGSLYRCVALFELCERLGAPTRWEHLGASHLRLVLGLAPSTQERILAVANAKRWTVKELQQEVKRDRSCRVSYGGRRPEPALEKSLKSVRKSLEVHRQLIEQGEGLSVLGLQQSMEIIKETRNCLERLSMSVLAKVSDNATAHDADRGDPPHAALAGRGGT